MRPIFFLFFPIFFLLQALSGYELDLRQCRLDSSGRTLFQTIGGKEKTSRTHPAGKTGSGDRESCHRPSGIRQTDSGHPGVLPEEQALLSDQSHRLHRRHSPVGNPLSETRRSLRDEESF